MPESQLVTALSGPLTTPLSEEAHRLMEASISHNTRRAYAAALDRLDCFLDGQPLTDETLANYLSLLHEHGHPSQRADHQPRPLSPPSLALIVQAVRFVEKLQQRPSSVVGPLTERTLAGARREGKARGRGQVAALTREHLAVMVRDAERKDTLAGMRDAALFRVMSDGLLRISEAVGIDCHHITEEADGSRPLAVAQLQDRPGRQRLPALPPVWDPTRRPRVHGSRRIHGGAAVSQDAKRRPARPATADGRRRTGYHQGRCPRRQH